MSNPRSGLAGIQEPAGHPCLFDVVNVEGDLVGRVPPDKANELIAAGAVSPIGRRRVKYLLLVASEPTIERPWLGGNHTTTRRMRGNGDVVIGRGNWQLEHKPLPAKNPQRAG
jgi:hypothetical protein